MGEDPGQGPRPDQHADDSADEPYLIWLPADRMRVDLPHRDTQRAAVLFAELIYTLAGRSAHADRKLALALGLVQDALGVSRDQYRVALADLVGVLPDAS